LFFFSDQNFHLFLLAESDKLQEISTNTGKYYETLEKSLKSSQRPSNLV
jgi:hypothetical protein